MFRFLLRYLMHMPVLLMLDHIVNTSAWGLHPLLDEAAFFAIGAGISIIPAVGLYATVERWYFRKPVKETAAVGPVVTQPRPAA